MDTTAIAGAIEPQIQTPGQTSASAPRVIEPSDFDLTFFMLWYHDHALAQKSLTRLRRHFPAARVLAISDGDHDPRYLDLAKRFAVDYRPGQRLYGVENGGMIVHRMFEFFNEDPTQYLFKIDTDTVIHRRFHYLPTGLQVFGTLEHATAVGGEALNPPNVQGGCMGFTKEAVQTFLNKEFFCDPVLQNPRQTFATTTDIIARAEQAGLVSFDLLVRYGCEQLEIPVCPFDDVHSQYQGPIHSQPGQFAVTHPNKELTRGEQFRELLSYHITRRWRHRQNKKKSS